MIFKKLLMTFVALLIAFIADTIYAAVVGVVLNVVNMPVSILEKGIAFTMFHAIGFAVWGVVFIWLIWLIWIKESFLLVNRKK